MIIASKCLDLFSALVMLVAGVYVEIVFADLLDPLWKVAIGVLVGTYFVVQTERVLVQVIRALTAPLHR